MRAKGRIIETIFIQIIKADISESLGIILLLILTHKHSFHRLIAIFIIILLYLFRKIKQKHISIFFTYRKFLTRIKCPIVF